MARWPTPAALAAASSGEAVRAWGRLGYPRRALRLHACAVACVERHDGAVPADPVVLRALPGVGSYTAAAVAAFAYGVRIPVVDTNVRRVVARWSLGLPALERIPGARIAELLPEDPADAVVTSAALMELGAVVCRARSPQCAACPIATGCRWLADGAPSAAALGLPARRAQGYEGTDRQARGRLLAALREAPAALPGAALAGLWPDPQQRDRALLSLLDDGLVVAAGDGYALPG
jgi:A/G-specific adenine glycosylase